jgi:transcriptional regulator with XRE-family HTH domain
MDRDASRDLLMRRVGTNIRRARETKGLTQVELAAMLNDDDQTQVSRWELGKRMPRPGSLMELSKALDCAVPDFFVPLEDENGDPQPESAVA